MRCASIEGGHSTDTGEPGLMALTDPGLYAERTQAALGHRYRLEEMVAASRERVLFRAYDLVLKRRVSLRVNMYPDSIVRAWFLSEAEALAQLDHPAIRHAYDAGIIGDLVFVRVVNRVELEPALYPILVMALVLVLAALALLSFLVVLVLTMTRNA